MKHQMIPMDLNVIAWTLIAMCIIALCALFLEMSTWYRNRAYNKAIEEQDKKDRLSLEMANAINESINPRIYTSYEGQQLVIFGVLMGIMLGVSGTVSAVRLIKRRKEKNARRIQS